MPIIDVLDADHDHEISATELKNATASLLTLDKNKDGKLTEEEFAIMKTHSVKGAVLAARVSLK